MRERLLLLVPPTSYRIADFLAAAERLGVDVIAAGDEPSAMEALAADRFLSLDFEGGAASAEKAVAFAARHRVDGVVAVDDAAVPLGAAIAFELGFPANPADAAAATRDKRMLRRRWAEAGLAGPRLLELPTTLAAAAAAARIARELGFPAVLKPRALSGSRGVLRVDDERQAREGFERISNLLLTPAARKLGPGRDDSILAEEFLPGPEVAVEGLLSKGRLDVLAIFDKPLPLDGPTFAETIYVTPSRSSAEMQERIRVETARAAAALGLVEGPIHAELRLGHGPILIELAARTIGGLCARVLRFVLPCALEELVIAHALRRPLPARDADAQAAAGVLMLPVPRAGRFAGTSDLRAIRALPDVVDVVITAHPGQELVPLPEGSTYVGFVFARAADAALVEQTLQRALAELEIYFEGE